MVDCLLEDLEGYVLSVFRLHCCLQTMARWSYCKTSANFKLSNMLWSKTRSL